MVKGHFKRNPEATPQDIERVLGFKMDMATVIETWLLKIKAEDEDTDTDAVTGRLEVDFSMTGTDEQHDLTCAIRVKQVHTPKRDVATLLRGCVLKKLIGMFREELSRLLKDGDRVAQMVHEADNEIEREYRTFKQKEGGAK
nr:MAG TPA: hypothetical protein [Caudoviricetes sp.]